MTYVEGIMIGCLVAILICLDITYISLREQIEQLKDEIRQGGEKHGGS